MNPQIQEVQIATTVQNANELLKKGYFYVSTVAGAAPGSFLIVLGKSHH